MKVTRENILAAMISLCTLRPATWQIRMEMGLKNAVAVRRELMKMESDGVVKRYLPWCTENCIRWVINPCTCNQAIPHNGQCSKCGKQTGKGLLKGDGYNERREHRS